MQKRFGFIVDTNLYSGNFEREMCAFMTGHVGDCGVGDKLAREFRKQYSRVKGVIQVSDPDYKNVRRPVTIATTPNVWNNGMGFHFTEGEEKKALTEYKKEIKEYNESHIRRVDDHRGKNVPTWTNEAINRAIYCYISEIKNAFLEKEVHKYPAYESLLIFFDETPDEKTINFLKKRAYEFCDYYGKGLSIRGFRFLNEKEYKDIL